jgi:thiol:disulfide interchange protein
VTKSTPTRKARKRSQKIYTGPAAPSRWNGMMVGLFAACALAAALVYWLPRETTVAGPSAADQITAPAHNYPASDPDRDIARALSLASDDHKAVLLEFGADWCFDCAVLAALFRDPSVEPYLDAHFHLVAIDLGEYYNGPDDEKNPAIAARYGIDPNVTGVPALALLDRHGRAVPIGGIVKWSRARTFSADAVLGYLHDLARAAG